MWTSLVTPRKPIQYVSRAELDRLKRVLEGSPGPSTIEPGEYPRVTGPGGLELWWRPFPASTSISLGKQLVPISKISFTSQSYMDLGMLGYTLPLDASRFLAWRPFRGRGQSPTWRMGAFDARHLEPLGWLPKRTPGDPLVSKGGTLGSIDIPAALDGGIHSFEFPDVFKAVEEILLVPFMTKQTRIASLYVLRPPADTVEVVPMPWTAGVVSRWRWISRIARDPVEGGFVGDGAGLRMFSLGPAGAFRGWIRKGAA